jgi:glutamine synthetase
VHLEFRAGDNTSNPHLFLAALLAAGLDGMERGLDPEERVQADIGHWTSARVAAQGIRFLPRSAREALDAVEADTVVMDTLGTVVGPAFYGSNDRK